MKKLIIIFLVVITFSVLVLVLISLSDKDFGDLQYQTQESGSEEVKTKESSSSEEVDTKGLSLSEAVESGDFDVVKQLVVQGGDIHVEDGYTTLLHIAAANGVPIKNSSERVSHVSTPSSQSRVDSDRGIFI